ncbi:MAG: hypothetical protein ACR2H3_10750 [Acidimicrobiales bacterium]
MEPTSLEMLSGLLWRERDALQRAMERIDTDLEETELSLRSLSSLELHRAILTREVAGEYGVGSDPTLPDLLPHLPPQWAAVLAGHRAALVGLIDNIDGQLADVDFPIRVDANDALLGNRALRTRSSVQRSLVDFLN